MKPSACKGCGREIFFAKNFHSGKKVPVEKCKAAYREMGGEFAPNGGIDKHGNFELIMVEQIKDETIFISHFLTCPAASQFSGKNKGGANG